MTYEGDGGTGVPRHHEIPHYHGDEARVVFVTSAVVLIIAQSIGAELPISTMGAVISAAVLVIAAGVTNPAQTGIHWFNALLALAGTILFGSTAVDHYRAGISFFDKSFIYIEALALLSLAALYLTTRTIRGIHLRRNF